MEQQLHRFAYLSISSLLASRKEKTCTAGEGCKMQLYIISIRYAAYLGIRVALMKLQSLIKPEILYSKI